ncbi:MAG: serine acetyltransferase [Saccharofermentans sp.]|nr:serine acetyltransferase [Saccharofermentans sp.]
MNDELMDIVYSDLYRYTGNARRTQKIYTTYLQEKMSSPEFNYISTMRRTRYYYDEIAKYKKLNDKWRARWSTVKFKYYNFILDRLSRKYHFQIPYDTNIGKGFYLAHFGRVIIHPKSVIGYNVNVSTGVVIGTQFRGRRKGAPTIGNFVWIGANAVIVGNVNIGNNVLIAPGAYVNFDVPDGSIVIGNPGLIRRAPGATLSYINNTIQFDEYNVKSSGVNNGIR